MGVDARDELCVVGAVFILVVAADAAAIWAPDFFNLRNWTSICFNSFRNSISSNSSALLRFHKASI